MAEFLLGGNPWYCNCTMEWLQNINTRPADSGR